MNLHLVAFNIPFPANYGGVIDVFYKIEALKEIGVKIYLHCFQYGRQEADELERICEKVFYYKRNTSIFQQFSVLPYIIKSRKNPLLLKNLMRDNYPILFEGLHCCGFINSPLLAKRLKIVRMHNIEWQYYQHLGNQALKITDKLFFQIESWRLKRFEKKLKVTYLLTISPNDTSYFKKMFDNIESIYIPAFHGNTKVTSKIGKGNYFLFHGDLSVSDNEKAALYLIEEIFNDLEIKLVIAGLNPREQLLAKENKKVEIRGNLSALEMQNLITNAQANILISYHSAGMKLKLLNALYNGRFCIVNKEMIKGLDLGELLFIGEDSNNLKEIIKTVNDCSFDKIGVEIREKFLQRELNDLQNARKIKELLINHN